MFLKETSSIRELSLCLLDRMKLWIEAIGVKFWLRFRKSSYCKKDSNYLCYLFVFMEFYLTALDYIFGFSYWKLLFLAEEMAYPTFYLSGWILIVFLVGFDFWTGLLTFLLWYYSLKLTSSTAGYFCFLTKGLKFNKELLIWFEFLLF